MRDGITEIVVISGKGGTGKTSLVASFAALSSNGALADCDVDAPDLHLVLQPEIRHRETFRSGHEAVIDQDTCVGCGVCAVRCRFDAIALTPGGTRGLRYEVDPLGCEGCGVCAAFCPQHAIALDERVCGEWYRSDTRFGPLVHARLGIAAENSGKLVSLVRTEARRLAAETGRRLVLVDGSPGIGCPVIASITGASLVVVVTEPTLSGEHDLGRVLSLTGHFGLPAAVCVNKWDLNPGMTEGIERRARHAGAAVAGRVRYDPVVTEAQVAGKALAEFDDGPAAKDVEDVWNRVRDLSMREDNSGVVEIPKPMRG